MEGRFKEMDFDDVVRLTMSISQIVNASFVRHYGC